MEALTKQRTAYKNVFVRLETFIAKNKDKDVYDIKDYVVRRDWLVKAFNDYNTVQDEIEYFTSEHPNDYSDCEDREEMEQRYCHLVSEIDKITERFNSSRRKLNLGCSDISESKISVKLPELNIPVFSGNISNWMSFSELFSTLIIENKSLSDIQKFIYLKSFPRDEPLDLINNLQLTGENFKIALNTLKDRYENKLLIINSHLRYMLETPTLSKFSVTQLREFITKIKQHLESLKNLGIPVEKWDLILIFLFSQKLDFNTRKAFEMERNETELPTLKEFFLFLEKRCTIFENLNSPSTTLHKPKPIRYSHHTRVNSQEKVHSDNHCLYCNLKNHNIYKCIKFKNLTLKNRNQIVKEKSLCFNCLGSKHSIANCLSRGCTICGKIHHTLLHNFNVDTSFNTQTSGYDKNIVSQNSTSQNNSFSSPNSSRQVEFSQDNNTALSTSSQINSHILLATVCINIFSHSGELIKVKALLDPGSQSSFITENCVKRLKLPTFHQNIQVAGISNCNTSIKQVTKVTFTDESNLSEFIIDCYVLNEITCKLPQIKLNYTKISIPPNIKLADPTFFEPSTIDILLGCDIYYSLICPDIIRLGKNAPILQKTYLGWVIMGPIAYSFHIGSPENNRIHAYHSTSQESSLDETLRKFWLTEEVDVPQGHLSPDDEMAETIFKESTSHLESGYFQVDLPLKADVSLLGDSFTLAKRRFESLEARFAKDRKLFDLYSDFIDEYIKLNHARYVPIKKRCDMNRNQIFLPHHCVLKQKENNVSIRVVFDGSMKTTSGFSLNDIMLKGYQIQPDLFDILCRFRTFIYVFTTDIAKMFRNIRVNPDQTHLQNILWRRDPSENFKCIELTTVTYGTRSAPFLATRTLKELALRNKNKFPLAYRCIVEQCYIDDFICGAHSVDALNEMFIQLESLCSSAHFTLHKWKSNSPEFIKFFNDQNPDRDDNYIIEMSKNPDKVLGLMWNPCNDEFLIKIPNYNGKGALITKRNVLSTIAQIFDPLGLIAPIIIRFKIFLQKIWICNVGWDDRIDSDLLTEWMTYLSELSRLDSLRIPRLLYYASLNVNRYELIGFCDASMKAFGCSVYLRTVCSEGSYSTRLICAKSKVAPIKTISLPKLELNSAVLLSKLTKRIIDIYNSLDISKIYLFSDSEITLSWISSHPSRWSVFVANRVAIIQNLTSKYQWSHVRSSLNPADLVSRGLSPAQILKCPLWWNGPNFISDPTIDLEKLKFVNHLKDLPEKRKVALVDCRINPEINIESLSEKFSSFTRFHRSITYCFRFSNNCRSKEKTYGELRVFELQNSLNCIIRLLQEGFFPDIISSLMSKSEINYRQILKLSPFLDKEGILRVGGRLSLSNLPFDQKHPILLPSNSHFVRLMLTLEHKKLLHGGPQTVLSNFRLRYWPLNGLKEIKRIINKCITCYKLRSKNAQQIMANLPKVRISTARVFSNVGLDYAGPLMIKSSNLRKAPLQKCYVCIFVCMAIKAVHIELVSDLTTDVFLAALKRFISRRGNPTYIYSDNATNFMGAKNKLKDLLEFFKNQNHVVAIENFLSSLEIQWKFIPPHSPHWGGIWEAAVKSTKFHLNRVVGNSLLTFEELSTVLSQIESILNSRPLCPLSNDPSDLSCLTPGHFLIGAPLTSFPDKDISDIPSSRLSRWQHCTKLQQNFWKRWSVEYLHNLQHKPKWLKCHENIKVGDLVLLKVDNLPPLRWSTARVTKVFPSNDDRVRVVEVKTENGTFTRPISKVCPLPIESL